MSELKTIYHAEIEVLSPLHIGSGKALQRGFDYTVAGNRTWRINEDALFNAVYERAQGDRAALNRLLLGRPAEELLQPDDYRLHPEFFRYAMPGVPRAQGQGAELRECMKDVYDRPYIPGSSFKGALRTVLTWAIFRGEKLRFDVRSLGRNRSWAGQPVERQAMGPDPNHDLLRALQVADSQPVGPEQLMLANVQVVAGDHTQSPIEVEALRQGSRLKLTLTLDEYLLGEEIARQLRWGQRGDYLRHIADHARSLAQQRIRGELARLEGRPEMARVIQFYRLLDTLRERLQGSQSFIVQMSWGGGWGAKTLGSVISDDPRQFEQVIDDFRLSRSRNRQPGDAFPRSRRIFFDGRGPALPLGWVMVEVGARAVEGHTG